MKPILIHKGDDTIFADCQHFLTFNIETDLDLTGWRAKFILGWITKEISDISSKQFEIILSSEDTKTLRLGSQCGQIILTDSNGNIKTITNSILFKVVTTVIETEYQKIDLTIPESTGVDIKLKVGVETVTSVNGMTGDVNLTAQDVGALPVDTYIPSIEGLATEEQLQQGLNNKQDKGNYALKSEIPKNVSSLTNDANYQTATDVASMIASIPQFSISIVDSLPSSGQKMVLYLVPKTSASGDDIYDEYIWIESTSAFELVGSTTVDLADYYTKTEIDAKGYLTSYTETDPVYTADKPNLALKSEIPTKTSQLTNDSGFVTQDALLEKTTETWTFTLEDGTEVTKTMVLGA